MDERTVPAVDADLISVSEAAIDPAALVAHVARPDTGATVLFLGTVRDHSDDRPGVTRLEYEAYREVVEGKIAGIVAAARGRWDLGTVAAVHRVGSLGVGEISVAVAVSSGHRPEAFAAARAIIDDLKAQAPIWKKEHWAGGAEWVEEGEER